jgi:hypothetical protein
VVTTGRTEAPPPRADARRIGAYGRIVPSAALASALEARPPRNVEEVTALMTAIEKALPRTDGVAPAGPRLHQADHGIGRDHHQPRPELVKPETTAVLPPPQDSVTTASAWPESPERRRARLRQEATDNQDNPAYRSPIVVDRDRSGAANSVTQAQQEEFRRRMAIQNAADPTSRRYLSEPPVQYRQASATAPTGDLG